MAVSVSVWRATIGYRPARRFLVTATRAPRQLSDSLAVKYIPTYIRGYFVASFPYFNGTADLPYTFVSVYRRNNDTRARPHCNVVGPGFIIPYEHKRIRNRFR